MPTYEEQRDIIVPRKAYVNVPASDELPSGDRIEMPRLTLRRSLLLSRWIDDVSQDAKVKQKLLNLSGDFAGVEEGAEGGGDAAGFNMIFGINSLISQIDYDKVIEFFSIITGKDADYIDKFWEPGWGFEAIKTAFQQQGFGKMFSGNTETVVAEGSREAGGGPDAPSPLEQTPPTNVVSMVSST